IELGVIDRAANKGTFKSLLQHILYKLASCPGSKDQIYIRVLSNVSGQNRREPDGCGAFERSHGEKARWFPIVHSNEPGFLQHLSHPAGVREKPASSLRQRHAATPPVEQACFQLI